MFQTLERNVVKVSHVCPPIVATKHDVLLVHLFIFKTIERNVKRLSGFYHLVEERTRLTYVFDSVINKKQQIVHIAKLAQQNNKCHLHS